MESFLWLIPCLPLLGAITCGLLHASILKQRAGAPGTEGIGKEREKLVGAIATGAVALSFVLAVVVFFTLMGMDEHGRAAGLRQSLFTWLPGSGSFPAVAFGFQLDPWAITLTLVVTGVSALIHLYAVGYMHGDPGFARFFAYLNLFVFAMLVLVTGSSLPLMFIGWEGVGLCSYLLIGFWYSAGEEKGFPADSGRKAFIVNRIGDFGFLLGMFMLALHCGSFEFAGIREAIVGEGHGSPYLTAAALLLFLGACGKSAQIPLYVWLPDAMAGPTPVSALIHAATMVTAGVYMIGRLDVVFAISPTAAGVVATIGALTAIYAATMGLVAKDIKKVLAYSTVSQLGYMFLGAGMGALTAAMFHLVTHACFKALLFLGAGSVIHGCHDEQDITKMGGLKRYMKITHLTFVVGALALSGFPLLSGFFSKDEILWHAFQHYSGLGVILYAVGATAALLTAFYTFRLVFLVFGGKPRFDAEHHPPHESPLTMTSVLCALAGLTVLGALLGIPGILHPLKSWLEPSLAAGQELGHHKAWIEGIGWELVFMLIGGAIAVVGILLAWLAYRDGLDKEEKAAGAFPWLYKLLLEKYRVDEFYQHYVVRPLKGLAILSCVFDLVIVDGLVNGSARLAKAAGRGVSRLQSGNTQTYAAWIGVGTIFGLIIILILSA